MKVEMKLQKETKGTYVFQAKDPNALVPTLYIKKAAFETAPKEIVLEVKA